MDLKPCPFCGSDAELIDAPEPMNEGCVVVECTKCHASTCVSYAVKDDPRPVVIDAWNRRHEDAELSHLRTELASAKEELSLVKCGEPNHTDRAYAMKNWLKTFGHKVYCNLKHGEVGFVLSLLQEGEISRGKAAEAIAELLVGNEPPLPALQGNTFGDDEFPAETVAQLRAELAAERERRESAEKCAQSRLGMLGVRDVELHKANGEYVILKEERDSLASQLAAAQEQNAALAAALEKYEDHTSVKYGAETFPCFYFPERGQPDCPCGLVGAKRNSHGILSALKSDERRKGAVWAREYIAKAFEQWNEPIRATVIRSLATEMDAAIERGEVEVPNE